MRKLKYKEANLLEEIRPVSGRERTQAVWATESLYYAASQDMTVSFYPCDNLGNTIVIPIFQISTQKQNT